MQTVQETKLWRVQKFHRLELLKATFTTHVFPKHLHETYVIEIVEQGADVFFCDGHTYTATAGSVVVINPFEVHTGKSAGKTPLVYRSMYPSPVLMQEILADLALSGNELHLFQSRVRHDRKLFANMLALHLALEQNEERLACESLMLTAITQLTQEYSDASNSAKKADEKNRPACRAREFLIECSDQKISLQKLAKSSGASPFHLLRSFRKAYGIPPHEFLINVRVERAKRLLAQGAPISQTALETGFCDQSHLSRHFKRLTGVTPKQYADY